MTQEDIKFLSEYESNFKTAINSNYTRNILKSPLLKMLDIYQRETGKTYNLCTHCTVSVLAFLKVIGKMYFDVFRWDKGNDTPIVKTAPKQVINDQSLEWTDDITTIKDNRTLLTEFCTEKKNSGDDKEQLKKFYNYYVEKANGWKGTFNITALYNKWMTNAKAA